ncbi:hypothetical protein ACWD4G_36420 [Streptomyces sp. NPDC002643]
MKNREMYDADTWKPKKGLTTEEAVADLDSALRRVGIILPSLGVDPVSGASKLPYPLVSLGRCNLLVAARLADVLRTVPEPEPESDEAEAIT